MPGRRAWGLAAVALVAVAAPLASAAPERSTPQTETFVLTPNDRPPSHRTRYAYTSKTPFTVEITGTISVENGGYKGTFDALYCVSCSDHGSQSRIEMDSKLHDSLIPATGGGLWRYHFVGRSPAYNAQHRYVIPFEPGDYGFLTFKLDTSCTECKFRGAFSIRIIPTGKPEEETKLRVDFLVRASGKPNIPIAGAGAQPSASRVSGSGHATFTKKVGSRLEATQTKGSIVHTDGGRTMKLGIISGSTYFPATHKLVLLLKVNDSDDPACESSGFLTGVRAATLTLLPVTGEPDLGTVIFAGIPVTKKILPLVTVTPCKGHFHGWERGGGVSVRVVVRESKA